LSFYADTSFLVSLYLSDAHSADARARVPSAPNLSFTPLHRAEWAHAVSQHQFRGKLSGHEARKFEQQLEDDINRGIWVPSSLPDRAFEVCTDLVRRYGPKLGVRTLDTLHVASALELKAGWFWTFDERQAKLAAAEGLKTS